MTEVDCVQELSAWFAQRLPEWTSNGIRAGLRDSARGGGVNKAEVTFESPTHVASVTAWDTGTVDLDVLDLATGLPEGVGTWAFRTVEELRALLSDCEEYLRKLQGGRF